MAINLKGRPFVRRTTSERMRLLEERKRQIEAQLQSLTTREREAERKRETRRKVIVGAAVLAHAELNPNFADQLREILEAAVQRPADRQTLADLLPGAPQGTSDTHTRPAPPQP
jgi:hypothetical protein